MKFRSKPTADACLAARCKQPPIEEGFCAQHYNEWTAEGKPTKPGGGSDLAVVKAELEPVRNGVEQFLQFAATVPFDAEVPFEGATITGLAFLGKCAAIAKQQLEMVETKRTSITKPILEAKRNVDALFAPVKTSLEALIKCCKTRSDEYAAARDATREQALAAVGMGERDESVLVVAHGQTEELPDEFAQRTDYVIKVVDFARVPDEFKLLNEALVKAYARKHRNSRPIPGLEITEVKKTVFA